MYAKAKDEPAAEAANVQAMQTALEKFVGAGNATVSYSLQVNPDSKDKDATHPTWNCVFKEQETLMTSPLQTLSLNSPVP